MDANPIAYCGGDNSQSHKGYKNERQRRSFFVARKGAFP